MMVAFLLFVGVSALLYSSYERDDSVFDLAYFHTSSLLQYSVSTAPLLPCIILVRQLSQRFLILNSVLRYSISFLQLNRSEKKRTIKLMRV